MVDVTSRDISAAVSGVRRLGRLSAAMLGAALSMLSAGAMPAAAHEVFLPNIITSSTVPANGDLNPYGVSVVPAGFPSGGIIHAGDVLISNFNNSSNLLGTGSTIIKLTANGLTEPNGQAAIFFQGGSPLGLNAALSVLSRGLVLVGSLPTTDGTPATLRSGAILVIDRNGHLVQTISSGTNTLDGPYGMFVFDEGNRAIVFVSNVLNGTVTRLDLNVGTSSVSVASATVIGSGFTHETSASALVLGPVGLAFDPFIDVLFVASQADNGLFAITNAGNRGNSAGRGINIAANGQLRGPVGMKFSPDFDLLVANSDALNADAAQPSEILEFTENGQFVTQFNVDAQEGGAFGLQQAPTDAGTFSLIVGDDVTNTLQLYPLSP
jgi:hypothetical protein